SRRRLGASVCHRLGARSARLEEPCSAGAASAMRRRNRPLRRRLTKSRSARQHFSTVPPALQNRGTRHDDAGRSVVFSGLTVAIGLALLLFSRLPFVG